MKTSLSASAWEMIGRIICCEKNNGHKPMLALYTQKMPIVYFFKFYVILEVMWQGWHVFLSSWVVNHFQSTNAPDVNSSEEPQQLVMTTEKENTTSVLESSKSLYFYVINILWSFGHWR